LGDHTRKRTLGLGEEDRRSSKNIKGTPKHNTMRSTLGKRIDATRSIRGTPPLDANVQNIRRTPPLPKFTTRR
jgi:hypothetical protein